MPPLAETELEEKLEPVLRMTDSRYTKKSELKEVNDRCDAVLREIAELKAAPAFITKDNLERGNTKPEIRLSSMLHVIKSQQKTGRFPSGKHFEKEVQYVQKAFSEGSTTAGGFLIPEEWNSTIVEELGAKAVVLKAGPNVVPIVGKQQHLSGFGTDATCEWLDEAGGSTESTSGTVEGILKLKTARLLSKTSIEWLEDGNSQTENAFVNNMIRVISRFVDSAFLIGSGSNRPTGMASVGSITTLGAANNAANGGAVTLDDLLALDGGLNAADVPEDNRAFFMSSRSWDRVRALKDTTGRPLVYVDLQNPLRRFLFGYPVYVTNKIPNTQTKGTSGAVNSTILEVDMSDIYVGVGSGSNGLRIDVSEHAAFSNAQVAYRIIFRCDILPGHAASIGALTGVN